MLSGPAPQCSRLESADGAKAAAHALSSSACPVPALPGSTGYEHVDNCASKKKGDISHCDFKHRNRASSALA